jgi:hypothetical protein
VEARSDSPLLATGKAHFDLKHYEQALADIAKAVELTKAVSTLDGGNVLECILEDVALCPDEKFRAGMRAIADKALQDLKSKPGARSDTPVEPSCLRATIDVATGEPGQVDLLLQDVLQGLRKKDAPKSVRNAAWLAKLGNILVKQQQYVAVEPFLRECLAMYEHELPDHWLRYHTLSMLGGALLGQQKYAEAEPLLLQGYEGMEQRRAQDGLEVMGRLVEATERLIRLYEATNQPEKARMWREKLPSGRRPGS